MRHSIAGGLPRSVPPLDASAFAWAADPWQWRRRAAAGLVPPPHRALPQSGGRQTASPARTAGPTGPWRRADTPSAACPARSAATAFPAAAAPVAATCKWINTASSLTGKSCLQCKKVAIVHQSCSMRNSPVTDTDIRTLCVLARGVRSREGGLVRWSSGNGARCSLGTWVISTLPSSPTGVGACTPPTSLGAMNAMALWMVPSVMAGAASFPPHSHSTCPAPSHPL